MKYVARRHAIAAGHHLPLDVEFAPLADVADTVYRNQRETHGSHPPWKYGMCPRCTWATELVTRLEDVAVEVGP